MSFIYLFIKYTYRIIFLSYCSAITSHVLYKSLDKETSYLKSFKLNSYEINIKYFK